MFESFPLHTLSSVSVLVNKSIEVSKTGERESYFDDELFCKDKIDKSEIEGIMIPEHLTNLPVSKVNCLPDDLSCFTKRYLFSWLAQTEKYFNQKIPADYIERVKRSYEQLWQILDNYSRPERWIITGIQKQREQSGEDIKDILASILSYLWSLKYNTENSIYFDILMRLNEENLPVYEIGKKALRKIN